MVAEKWVYLHETKRMITFHATLCVINAIATIIFFFLYVRARMAGLEQQERRYLSLHFITLFLFVLFGILILVRLSDSINSGASYSAVDVEQYLFADQLPRLL